MIQLILHLIGDYVSQTDSMAARKNSSTPWCLIHVVLYSLPFLLIAGWGAVLLIGLTHFFIDRYRLAVPLIKWKNVITDPRYLNLILNCPDPFTATDDDLSCQDVFKARLIEGEYDGNNGGPISQPVWLSTFVLIVVDNTLHLVCNALIIYYV